MATGALLPVREYASADEMRRHAAELRARTFAPRVAPMPSVPAVRVIDLAPPAPSAAELENDSQSVIVPVEQIVAVAPSCLPPTAAQREGRAQLRSTDCLRVVSQVTGIRQKDIIGEARLAPMVKARQITAWLLVNRAGRSLPAAGLFLGGRDHTTMLHSCKRVDAVALPVAILRNDIVALVDALWNAPWPRFKATRQ